MKPLNKILFNRIILVITDMLSSFIFFGIAVYLAFNSLNFMFGNTYLVLAFLTIQIGMLALFKVYDIRLIDSSLELVVKTQLAQTISSIIVLLLFTVYTKDIKLALRTIFIFYTSSSFFILGYRVIYRVLFSYHPTGNSEQGFPRTLIYGAGELGSQLSRLYFKRKLPKYIIGFIDDDMQKQHSILYGIPVLGQITELEKIVNENKIGEIIIAITNISKEKMQYALDASSKFGLRVQITPSLFELERGNKKLDDLRAISYEDLLGRKPIVVDRQPIEQMVRGNTIAVTGAGGSIGNEICKQLARYSPDRVLLIDIDETEVHTLSLKLHNYQKEISDKILPIVCDIRNKAKIEKIFNTYKPNIVFHAAAYKHVPLMEYYPEEAIETNIIGTQNIFNAAISSGVKKCILISTDKAVNPTNIMGATKRVAEKLASTMTNKNTEIVCVRFGNVLGSRGSMLPLFIDQIREDVPITVTDKNIIRYFMTIPEAVSLVFLAGAIGGGGEVMVLDMGEQVNIYEFAKKLIQYYGDGDSKINITGLRPGEKLYEEKLNSNDLIIPTSYPKVYKAKVDSTVDKECLDDLIRNSKSQTQIWMIDMLKKIVPEFEYKSNYHTSSKKALMED